MEDVVMVYSYSGSSGEYLCEEVALYDPRVPGRVLVPANATLKPPQKIEGKIPVYVQEKDEWEYADDLYGKVCYDLMGSEIKIDRHTSLLPQGLSFEKPIQEPPQEPSNLDKRVMEYSEVDTLMAEANMEKLLGNNEKSKELRDKAKNLYLEIREKYPIDKD